MLQTAVDHGRGSNAHKARHRAWQYAQKAKVNVIDYLEGKREPHNKHKPKGDNGTSVDFRLLACHRLRARGVVYHGQLHIFNLLIANGIHA